MHLDGRLAGFLTALIFALTSCGTLPAGAPPAELAEAPALPEPAPPPPEPPPPEPAPPRVLTLLTVADPLRYPVVDEGHPAKYFGSVGRLVASADANSKTSDFTEAARRLDLRLGAELTAALERTLQRDGWIVRRVELTRDRPDALLADPAAYAGDGEAVLDVAIGSAGYSATTIDDPYGPCVTVLARLSAASRARTVTPAQPLYTEQISAGSCAFPGYAALPGPAAFRYDSYDALAAHAAAAVDGLRRAAGAVALRIGPEVARSLP